MTTIYMKPAELAAIAIAASTEATRYYLNGVCVESYSDGTHGLIATDGHRLHSINTQEKAVEHFIFASDDIKKALAMLKAEEKTLKPLKHLLRIIVEHTPPMCALKVSIALVTENELKEIEIHEKASFTTKAIEGNFPDWRRIMPTSEPLAGPIGFNGFLAHGFTEAAKLLGDKSALVIFNSNGTDNPIPVSIQAAPAFKGVLMPMRFSR
jgi:DNA polymerase III sliding clamp (beta) subunit (PCNA family)